MELEAFVEDEGLLGMGKPRGTGKGDGEEMGRHLEGGADYGG